MKLSIGRKIATGFACSLVALLIICAVTSSLLQQLSRFSFWVQHTHIVQKDLADLQASILQTESSARGYQLVNDASFRAVSQTAMDRTNSLLGELRRQTADNPVQQERLDRLDPLVAERLADLRKLDALRAPGGPTATDLPSARNAIVREGETYMDQVRQIIDDMNGEEARLLKIREADESGAEQLTSDVIIGGALASVFFVVGVGFLVTRSITAPLRALSEGAATIGQGDYAHRVDVSSNDEVGDLARHFNTMAGKVQERQSAQHEQDWLKSGLSRFSELFVGQRDPVKACEAVLSELATRLDARHSVLYVPDETSQGGRLCLKAAYAFDDAPAFLAPGQGLVGQCWVDQKRIVLNEVPEGYFRIRSVLGESAPRAVVVFPALFDHQVRAVVELGLMAVPAPIQLTLLERLGENLGIVLHTIAAGKRTEDLLRQAEDQAAKLRSSELMLQEQQEELKQTNEELEQTNEELQQTNEELEEKAMMLATQKREVETKNTELDHTRTLLEEKAMQIALTSKYKSEFLANMSHELRTPLNSLLILSKMLADNPETNLTPKQVQYAETINSSGNDLLELINEVLDLAKIESGAVQLDLSDMTLAGLSEYVEQSFRHVAETRKLEFEVKVSEGLPASIRTDGRRLQQILKNLLSNAFKFTEKGSVMLTVTPGRTPAGSIAPGLLAFSVHDTGIGIPPDKQALIFEAFQQGEAGTARKYGGTGLGLSISRELAALLGGTLAVESAAGQGSSFTLTVPVRLAKAEAAPSPPAPSPALRRETPTLAPAPAAAPAPAPSPAPAVVDLANDDGIDDDRARINPGDMVLLIVEDDRDFARLLMDFARDKRFKAVVARTVNQGIALARHLQPSAITLDLHLPDNEGWVLLDQMKHDPQTRHIPIHIISADGERDRSLRLGAVSHFCKPVTKENLDAALTQTIDLINRPIKNLLIVEDDGVQRASLVDLIGNGDVKSTAVGTAREAFECLAATRFDCVVLDLGLPDMSGIAFIREMHTRMGQGAPPVIVYTGRELSREEETELRMISDAIVIKNVRSPERLLDETALFLHRVQTKLPEGKRRMIEQVQRSDSVLKGRRVLVVDDDVRNIFAITSALEASQMTVTYAESGPAAIELLQSQRDVEIVLMDVMMPGMDGFETIRRIRAMDKFKKLPIISVTAKAMKGDREKCLEAGASDYITKPVDMEQLRSLLRVWLYQ